MRRHKGLTHDEAISVGAKTLLCALVTIGVTAIFGKFLVPTWGYGFGAGVGAIGTLYLLPVLWAVALPPRAIESWPADVWHVVLASLLADLSLMWVLLPS